MIDLSGLNSIDSSGIGTLVSCAGHIARQGGQMRLVARLGSLGKVLEMVHMERIIRLDADLASACRNFRADANR